MTQELHSQEIIDEIGMLLLEIGTLLMSSGATTERIRLTVQRFAQGFGYNSELLITHHAIMLTMSQKNKQVYSHLRRCSPHAVNFKILSGISNMSWSVVNEQWTLIKIKNQIAELKALPAYPRWLILGVVSLSGASFCRLFGGDIPSMLITFFATGLGLFARQEMSRKKFNFYLCIVFGSFVASLFSGYFLKLHQGSITEPSFASCILFLAPGIPLINSFTDLLDGNLLNGLLRGLNGLLIAFAMAVGWLMAVLIYGI